MLALRSKMAFFISTKEKGASRVLRSTGSLCIKKRDKFATKQKFSFAPELIIEKVANSNS